MPEPIIRLEDLSCRHRLPGGAFREALKNLSLEVQDGESLVVLGAGAAGKTTLAAAMAGVHEPSSGAVVRGGALTTPGRSLPIGLVTQNPEDTFTSPVVREEMALVLENLGWEEDEMDRAVREMLELIGLAGRGESPPSSLSGGQKQLLAAASILVAAPRLLLLDEPLSLLDTRGRREVKRLLEKRKREGGAVVYFTSEVGDITLGRRVAVLQEGRLVWTGAVGEFPLDERQLTDWRLEVPELTRLAALLPARMGVRKARLWSVGELAVWLCR